MDTEMSEETTVWRDGKIFGKHIPLLGEETGKPDSGMASMIRIMGERMDGNGSPIGLSR
jgi:hypothetical protein